MIAVIAHRGASAYAPENTVEAYRLAKSMGADSVELDARRTADGAVIVHHDAAIEDGRVIVEMAASQLPSHIPSLAEALDACDGMDVNVEIKNWPADPDYEQDEMVARHTVSLLSEKGLGPSILVSSFNLHTIDTVRELNPDLATAYLVIDAGGESLERTVRHRHDTFHPWDATVTEETMRQAKSYGLKVNVWTVDDPERMAQLISWGVDGIVTNKPDVARQVVDSR